MYVIQAGCIGGLAAFSNPPVQRIYTGGSRKATASEKEFTPAVDLGKPPV